MNWLKKIFRKIGIQDNRCIVSNRTPPGGKLYRCKDFMEYEDGLCIAHHEQYKHLPNSGRDILWEYKEE